MLVQVQVHQVLKLTRKGIFTAEVQWAMVNPYNNTDITQRPSLWQLLHPLGPWEKTIFPQMIFLPLPKCVHTKKPAVSKQINKYYQDRKPREVELEFCDLKEPPLCLVAWSVPCFFQVICLVIMVVWGEWGGGTNLLSNSVSGPLPASQSARSIQVLGQGAVLGFQSYAKSPKAKSDDSALFLAAFLKSFSIDTCL